MPEPKLVQKMPFVKQEKPGTKAWCACGYSQNQPYCDGSHRDTEMTPMITEIEAKKTVAWCGCKHSNNKPFCDGSHNQL